MGGEDPGGKTNEGGEGNREIAEVRARAGRFEHAVIEIKKKREEKRG